MSMMKQLNILSNCPSYISLSNYFDKEIGLGLNLFFKRYISSSLSSWFVDWYLFWKSRAAWATEIHREVSCRLSGWTLMYECLCAQEWEERDRETHLFMAVCTQWNNMQDMNLSLKLILQKPWTLSRIDGVGLCAVTPICKMILSHPPLWWKAFHLTFECAGGSSTTAFRHFILTGLLAGKPQHLVILVMDSRR